MIDKGTRTLSPEWVRELDDAASLSVDRRIFLPGAKVRAGNPPEFHAATGNRRIGGKRGRGGGVPSELGRAFEFGTSDRDAWTTYQRRNRRAGGTHDVRRRTQRQIPRRVESGRVVYPTVAVMLPRMVSMWVQTIVRAYSRAVEGEAV
jgi:hypothetical protein